jgi:GTP-binding protein
MSHPLVLPTVALIGAPNVGKSTLFNRITKTRDALVADYPGLTRDRKYAHAHFEGHGFILVDTGGIGSEDDAIETQRAQQSHAAIDEADVVVLMVDAKLGCSAADELIAEYLRQQQKPTFLLVNKIDGQEMHGAIADFYRLGLGEMQAISASHGDGVRAFLTALVTTLPKVSAQPAEEVPGIHLAIVGRPNVGKSTLMNRILGEERVVVSDIPGTTMDTIHVPFTWRNQQFVLKDTAGVRRRGRVHQTVEKFSVIKTLQAIESSHVVILVLDGSEGVTEQDLHILQFVLEAGRAVVIAVNKWDGLTEETKHATREDLHRRLHFVDFIQQFFISAKHGTGVGSLFPAVIKAYSNANKDLPTAKLTEVLANAQQQHPPPLSGRQRIKLKYAHCGGHNPPLIVIHGNQVEKLPKAYQRYLQGYLRKAFQLSGTPIRLQFKSSNNPYQGRKNVLSKRQQQKRRRLQKFVRKKSK